jgi:hypothetical protein
VVGASAWRTAGKASRAVRKAMAFLMMMSRFQ